MKTSCSDLHGASPDAFLLEHEPATAGRTEEGVGSGPWLGGLEATCEDCMALMARYPDKHFDLAIVDPPYGIDAGKKHTGKGWVVRESKDWDKSGPGADYFCELYRVSKDQII